MYYYLKDGREVVIRPFCSSDFEKLVLYYNSLSDSSKARFAPHRFDRDGLGEFYSKRFDLASFVAIDNHTGMLVSYVICKLGFFDYDNLRFNSYGYSLNEYTDCFYAPSVADNWQGCGLGKIMFNFVLGDMKSRGFKRLFLWGGVQLSNNYASMYYNNLGFIELGMFEHNGLNRDMVFNI